MDRLSRVIEVVKGYYSKKNQVIDWNQWVFEGHVKVVASWVEEISKKYQFDEESVLAAAYLHDLAYAWTSKNDPDLDEKNETEARKVLRQAGFSEDEVSFIVDKIIQGHGRYDGKEPENLETKVLATADALAHFTTDFYLVICWNNYLFENLEDYRIWVLKKIERDFHSKIFFEEYKEVVKPCYQSIKTLFNLPLSRKLRMNRV